jgi:hypothetical protein
MLEDFIKKMDLGILERRGKTSGLNNNAFYNFWNNYNGELISFPPLIFFLFFSFFFLVVQINVLPLR